MFSLEDWKRRWEAVERLNDRNDSMDSNWSAKVADGCRKRILALLTEIVAELAYTKTTPADLFDRPELVAVQQAARYLVKRSVERKRPNLGDRSYVPTIDEALRDPKGFVDGMTEEGGGG